MSYVLLFTANGDAQYRAGTRVVRDERSDGGRDLTSVDTILMGRVTYEGLSSYWPYAEGDFADYMNETPKIVFSKESREVEWGSYHNVRLSYEDVVDEVRRLKRQDDGDMVIFGGAGLTKSFTDAGLIDEYAPEQ